MNLSLKWDNFGLNFLNQLVGLCLFNCNYARCDQLLSVGHVIMHFEFENISVTEVNSKI